MTDARRTVEVVWRIESPRLIASLTRLVRDVGLAEELAQDAFVAALEQWPRDGVPDQPGAWLMVTARHRAIDLIRREQNRGTQVRAGDELPRAGADRIVDEPIGDDLLSLVFLTCHPVLPRESRIALTLRLFGGLTTDEIARAYLVPSPTIGQRISAREAHAGRGARAVRGPAGRRDARAGRVGPRGDLPDLHRGARGDDGRHVGPPRPRRRGDAAWAACSPGCCRASPRCTGWSRSWSCRRHGSTRPRRRRVLLQDQDRTRGTTPDRARARGAGPRDGAGPPARAVHGAGRDRRVPQPCALVRDHRLGGDRRPLRRPRAADAVARRRAQPRGRRPARRRARRRRSTPSTRSRDDPRLARYHLLGAVRADVLRRLGRDAEADELGRAAALAPTQRERNLLLSRTG